MRKINSSPLKIVINAVLSVLLFVSAASAVPLIAGRRVQLQSPPSWVNSGAWSADGEALLLVDALNSKITSYSPHGERLKSIASPSKVGSLAFPRPSVLHTAQRGYLLEDEDGHLIVLGNDQQPKTSIDLLAQAKNNLGDVSSIFGWVPMDSSILAFGDIKRDNGWVSAFMRIPLANPDKFEILHAMAIGDPARNFNLLGLPFVASIGNDQGYFLVMAEVPYIMDAGSAGQPARRLAALNQYAGKRPTLPEKKGVESAQRIYQKIESSSFPAGLYGSRGFLYVLLRKAVGVGRTEWSLVKINPKTDKVVWVRPIKSSASHLTVIPGPENWAFLEKGPVESLGKQAIDSLLLVPTPVVEGN